MSSPPRGDLELLASYDFTDRNEEDIRAEWIEPLLRALGYGLGTRHKVIRNKPLTLRPPVRMVGSSRIEPDFIPTVFGARMWVIEAKRPVDDLFDELHLGQAWSYATDPRVDVPFMVLCDGRRLGVFDVTRPEWDTPVCDVAHEEIADRFDELFEILGAPRIAETIRTRQLRHLRSALEVQLDLDALDRTVKDVQAMVDEVRPGVVARREEIRSEARREVQTRGGAARDAVGLWGHAQHLNGPVEFRWADIDRAVELVRRQASVVRVREFDYFEKSTTPRGQQETRMWFPLRVIRLATAALLIEDEGCGDYCRAAAEQAAAAHATTFVDDPLGAAVYRLQKTLAAFGYRMAALMGDKLDEQAKAIASKLDIEEWLRRDGALGLTADDAYLRVAIFGPQAVVSQVEPWSVEAITAAADAVAKLLEHMPKNARYDHLQPAGDPWRDGWLAGDPLRDLSKIVLGQLAGSPPSPAVGAFASELLGKF